MQTGTKDHILQTAAGLIHRQGFNNTTIDAILREGGVGKGNFYYYFRSKEELGYALIEKYRADFDERILDTTFGRKKDPLKQISAFLDAVVQWQQELKCCGGCPLGNLAAELSDLDEGFREKLAEIFESWRLRIEQALNQARDQLQPGTNARQLSEFIVASLEGGIMLSKLKKDIRVLEACTQQLKHHLRGFAIR